MLGGVLVLLIAAAVGLWLSSRPAAPADGATPDATAGDGERALVARAVKARPPVASPPAPQKAPSPYGEYDLPIMGPGPDDHPDGPAHPHPITPEHLRIHHENALISVLYDALDARDFVEMRRLIADYRGQYPEDVNKMREGFEVMADCLEKPEPASLAAAQRYYDQERASTLRRLVRRNCLEPRN